MGEKQQRVKKTLNFPSHQHRKINSSSCTSKSLPYLAELMQFLITI